MVAFGDALMAISANLASIKGSQSDGSSAGKLTVKLGGGR